MPNLTEEQKRLLVWMGIGQTFKVCSDYGPMKGSTLPKTRLPIRLFQSSIEKLYQAGLITYEPKNCYGQRWDEFSLTPKGKEVACKVA
ncbi:hypothetical protein CSW98_12520 [Vibrio sp. HA2012]|nr:hypothetical protein CSW98_12520 [Vibrio sp. HA2012]